MQNYKNKNSNFKSNFKASNHKQPLITKVSDQSFSKEKSLDHNWVYGKHPVFAVLAAGQRGIYKILLTKNSEAEFYKELETHKIKVDPAIIKISDNNFIASLLPIGAVHQGLALKAEPLKMNQEDDLLWQLSKNDKNNLPPVLILDQLTDPHNIGAIIRTAAAFNVKNIIIPKHNFPKELGTISKSSSGMIEMVDLTIANNLNVLMEKLKNIGYWCIGLAGEATTNLNQVQGYDAVALVIGSEGDGIRSLVKKNCDLLVKIPMTSNVESLNASNAAAIAMYEIFGSKL